MFFADSLTYWQFTHLHSICMLDARTFAMKFMVWVWSASCRWKTAKMLLVESYFLKLVAEEIWHHGSQQWVSHWYRDHGWWYTLLGTNISPTKTLLKIIFPLGYVSSLKGISLLETGFTTWCSVGNSKSVLETFRWKVHPRRIWVSNF